MRQMVPFEKQSKKKQREYNAQQRGSWHGVKPVTRIAKSRKVYDRNELRRTERKQSPEY